MSETEIFHWLFIGGMAIIIGLLKQIATEVRRCRVMLTPAFSDYNERKWRTAHEDAERYGHD